MFRTVAYVALVAGFVAFSFQGLSGWRGFANRIDYVTPPESTSDETPLSIGTLQQKAMHLEIARGYPWPELREIVPMMKRGLPPDPTRPDADDRTRAVSGTLARLRVNMPTGRMTWPEVLDALRERFEPNGVKVLSGPKSLHPPAGLTILLPDREWTGIEVLSTMYVISQQAVGYQVSSEGVCVGTDLAVNYEMREAKLVECRDRTRVEHDAPLFDVEFRPDFVDATTRAIPKVIEAQTGVEVVVDTEIWDTGTAVRWRGEPRKLRDALNQLCQKLHAYWRHVDGRVWILRP